MTSAGLLSRISQVATPEILALTLLENFDSSLGALVLQDSEAFPSLVEHEAWHLIFERTAMSKWSTVSPLRSELRLLFVQKHQQQFHRFVDRLVEMSIGDQLPDPLSLALWFSRYKTDPIGAVGPYVLAIEQPQLFRDCFCLVESRAESFEVFRAAYTRLMVLARDWLGVFRYFADDDQSPARRVAFDELVGELSGRRRERRVRRTVAQRGLEIQHSFSLPQAELDSPYSWPTSALKDFPAESSGCKLRWQPMALASRAESVEQLAVPASIDRFAMSTKTDLMTSSSDDALKNLSTYWWSDSETRRLMDGSTVDVRHLMRALAFPSSEVERVTHTASLVNQRFIKRQMVVTIRPALQSDDKGAKLPDYAVLWQIPDSAGKYGDLQVMGADGLPLEGAAEQTVSAVRRLLDELLDPAMAGAAAASHSGERPIPVSYYARLERLSSQTWRIVKRPQTRAESEVKVKWSELIDPTGSLSALRIVTGKGIIALQTSGFSPREQYSVEVLTPPDLAVRVAELRVPQREVRSELPYQFADSTVILQVILSRSARLSILATTLSLALFALLVPILVNVVSTSEITSQLSYLLLGAGLPAVASIVFEWRRHGGASAWSLRSLRFLLLFFATAAGFSALGSTVLLDSYSHIVALTLSYFVGAVLICFVFVFFWVTARPVRDSRRRKLR